MIESIDGRRFAPTDEDAEARYSEWKANDPYPDVPCALLNAADFLDYVAATGMIHPFDPESRRLKPASYLADVGGPFRYWDGEGRLISGELGAEDSLTIPRNTIAFVTLAPKFRLPEYIALRFNLQIKYIHAGLLVGTGPLVDPGFTGYLYLPLHNLTDNDYTISVKDGLVWMEFTKVSSHTMWSEWSKAAEVEAENAGPRLQAPARFGTYHPFPEDKKRRTTLPQYLNAAFPGQIRSSIPAEIQKTAAAVRRLRNFGIVGIVAVVLTLVVLMMSVLQLVSSSQNLVETTRSNSAQEVSEVKGEIAQLQHELTTLERRLRQHPASPVEASP